MTREMYQKIEKVYDYFVREGLEPDTIPGHEAYLKNMETNLPKAGFVVGLAYTKDENGHTYQSVADLILNTITLSVDGEVVEVVEHENDEEFMDDIDNSDFDTLVSVN